MILIYTGNSEGPDTVCNLALIQFLSKNTSRENKANNMKDERPDITDRIAGHFNRDKTLQGASATPGADILEIDPDKPHHGEHNRRMAELGKLADVQKRVVTRILDSSNEKPSQPKRPHLTVVR